MLETRSSRAILSPLCSLCLSPVFVGVILFSVVTSAVIQNLFARYGSLFLLHIVEDLFFGKNEGGNI